MRLSAGDTYYISDIIGKYLLANQNVNIYNLPNFTTSRVVAVIQRDAYTPVIYSYLIDKNGKLWLLCYLNDDDYNNQIPSFIPWIIGSFITPEGMLSIQQQAYNEAHKDDTFTDWIKNNTGKVLAGIAGVYLFGKLITSSRN